MITNHTQAKDWINSAINDIVRAFKGKRAKDYADFAFRSQLAVEKLNKALLCFFGLKIEKVHTPSKIIQNVIKNEKSIRIDKQTEDILFKIITYSEFFEKQGAITRYGISKEDILIFPEDVYDSQEKIKDFLYNLKNVLENVVIFLQDVLHISEKDYEGLKQIKKFLGDKKKWK